MQAQQSSCSPDAAQAVLGHVHLVLAMYISMMITNRLLMKLVAFNWPEVQVVLVPPGWIPVISQFGVSRLGLSTFTHIPGVLAGDLIRCISQSLMAKQISSIA